MVTDDVLLLRIFSPGHGSVTPGCGSHVTLVPGYVAGAIQ